MRSSKIAVSWIGVALVVAGACGRESRNDGVVYETKDLGPGRCLSMNVAGVVVGVDADGRGFMISPDGTRRDLGNTADATVTTPLAVNASGAIAGYGEGPTGRHAAIWAAGSWSKIPTTSTWSVAYGIDDDGGVIGFASTMIEQFPADLTNVDPKSIPTEPPAMQAFVVSPAGSWTTLGAAGGANSAAYAVGPGGRIVGATETASGETHAFVHAGGAMRDLGTLGGKTSNAYGINANGDVVGVSTVAGSELGHAFIVVANTNAMRDLGTLGGDRSDARSINDSGVIVGGSTTADGRVHPFAYRNEHMIDLLSKEVVAKYGIARAEHVANTGNIVGWGVRTDSPPDGSLRCLMWTSSR